MTTIFEITLVILFGLATSGRAAKHLLKSAHIGLTIAQAVVAIAMIWLASLFTPTGIHLTGPMSGWTIFWGLVGIMFLIGTLVSLFGIGDKH